MKPVSTPSNDGSVGVVVATYGGDQWRRAGIAAAAESAQDDPNTRVEVFHWTGTDLSLGAVRNVAARRMRWVYDWPCDWLVFLDADDRLPPDYVTKMREAEGDVRQPKTRAFYADGSKDDEAHHIPRVRLIRRNFIVVGAMTNAEMFWAVGGFQPYPCLEDWDLWLRMYCYVGATIGQSEAVYEVGCINADSRNSDEALHAEWYYKIRNLHHGAFRERRWR